MLLDSRTLALYAALEPSYSRILRRCRHHVARGIGRRVFVGVAVDVGYVRARGGDAVRLLRGVVQRAHLPGVRNSKTLVVMEEVKETTRIPIADGRRGA